MSKLRLLFIPDPQVREGVPTDHLLAVGRYIVAHRPDVIVVAGDWWDMPSCSMFNTKKSWEGLRIKKDLQLKKAKITSSIYLKFEVNNYSALKSIFS